MDLHFQVPQFIETEDKIIGPLTLKQFLYIASTGFLSFGLFFITAVWLWFILAFILMSIGVSLAFVKVNGRSMLYFLKSAIFFFWNPQTYVFQTKRATTQETAAKYVKAPPVQSKLKDIGERLATSKVAVPKREAALPPTEASTPEKIRERYQMVRRVTGDRELAKKIDYR